MALSVGEVFATLDLRDSEFYTKINRVESKWSKFGSLIGKATAVGAAAATTAVAGFAAKGVKDFVQFENGMNEVFTLMPGVSQDVMDSMSDDVRSLSKEMGIAHSEAVPALYQALSAGVPRENVFEFMETAGKAAVGGITDMETAVDGITSVVNAFGSESVSAQEASDLMFTAVRLGKTDFNQLASNMSNVAPIASSLGVDFEDVTAALAVMTAQGTPTSVATTQMRAAFVELSKDGTKTSDLFKELSGKTFAQFIAEGGNTQQALQLLADHAEKSGGSVADLFGSVEAGSAALSLTGKNTETFKSALDEMKNSAGATDAAYAQMEKGLSRAFQKIKVAFDDAALTVGTALAPALHGLADWAVAAMPSFAAGVAGAIGAVTRLGAQAGPVVSRWLAQVGPLLSQARDGLSQAATATLPLVSALAARLVPALSAAVSWLGQAWTQVRSGEGALGTVGRAVLGAVAAWAAFRAGMAAVTAAVAPVLGPLMRIGGQVASLATKAAAMHRKVGLAATASKGLGVAVSALGGPVAIAVAALAAIGVALVTLYRKNETFRNAVNTAWNAIKNAFSSVQTWFTGTAVPAMQAAFNDLKGQASGVASAWMPGLNIIKSAVTAAFGFVARNAIPALMGAFRKVSGVIMPVVRVIDGPLVGALKILAGLLLGAVKGAISGVMQIFRGLGQVFSGTLQVFKGLISGQWSQVWEGLKNIFKGFVNVIVGTIKTWLNVTVLGIFRGGLLRILTSWKGGFAKVRSAGTSAMNAIKSVISNAWAAITGFFRTNLSSVSRITSTSMNGIKSVYTRHMNLMKSIGQRVLNALKNVFSNTFNAVRNLVTNIMTRTKSSFGTQINATKTQATTTLNSIKSSFKRVFTAIRDDTISLVTRMKDRALSMIDKMKSGITSKFDDAVAYVKEIPGRILNVFSDAGSLLKDAGKAIAQGLVDGIKSMAGAVADAAGGIASGGVDKVRGLLGIRSPSRVFDYLGRMSGEGLERGLRNSTGAVERAAQRLAAVPRAESMRAPTVRPILPTTPAPIGFRVRPSTAPARPAEVRIRPADLLTLARMIAREMGVPMSEAVRLAHRLETQRG